MFRKRRTVDELLLFYPAKHPEGDWAPEGLRRHDVHMQAEDGTRIHGWYCPAERPRGVLLASHGNAGNVATRVQWLEYLQSNLRVSTLMFDYRGYGRSQGVPTVAGALQDARAARQKLRDVARVKDSQMWLMGESLGGAIAVQLAAESACRGLILQSTFSSLRAAAHAHYPLLSWTVPKQKLNSAAQIVKHRGPLLQSHGTADRVIPLKCGEALFQAGNEPKTFIALAGAGHDDWLTNQYLRRLDQFIAGRIR